MFENFLNLFFPRQYYRLVGWLTENFQSGNFMADRGPMDITGGWYRFKWTAVRHLKKHGLVGYTHSIYMNDEVVTSFVMN